MQQSESNIYSAKYIAEKWSNPIFEAVRNSTPLIQSMSESDVRFIIGVCAGLNIMYDTLYSGPIDSSEWASSVVECSIIMAYVSHYDVSQILQHEEEYWVSQIERARGGLLGQIPGTAIEIRVKEEIVSLYKPLIDIPKRICDKTVHVKQYFPNSPKTYLMRDENTGYTKIGKSINPRHRERTLQSEKPTITLFKVCDTLVEKELHLQYYEKRIRGEWFDLTQDEIEEIVRTYNFYEPQDE